MSSLGKIDFASQKMFGRSSEIRLLRTQFGQADRSPLAVFVKGPSGSGKSILVESALKSESADDFIFLSGKFDQFQSGDAYSVLVDAFSVLSKQDAESGTSDMRKSLMENSALLQIIPSMQVASALGQTNGDDDEKDPDDDWGFGLLKMMLSDFLKKLCKLHKTVLFLDDLQWCDESYIELISTFLNDENLTNFMFVGAIRTEDESSCNKQVLDGIRELETLSRSTSMNISNLELETCNDLISNLLRLEPETTKELATVVHRKTDGNAFFVMQFIEMLERSKLLYYTLTDMKWHFDLKKIEGETNLADNLVGAVVSKIKQLPIKAQDMLKVAACLGGRFDPSMVQDLMTSLPGAAFIDDLTMSEMLEQCLEEGLLTSVIVNLQESSANKTFYRFSHDKIQQASYSLISESRRPAFHLILGRLLRVKMEHSGNALLLLITTRQLNRGRDLVRDGQEKLRLAQLNLSAAKTLRKRSAFFPASDFADISLQMLDDHKWNNYDLYLETITTGAELDYCCGKASTSQARVEEILDKARTLKDKLRAYFRLVDLHTLNLNYDEATNVGYDLLKSFGIDVQKKGRLVPVAYEFLSMMPLIKKKSDSELLAIPATDDEDLISTLKMLQALLSATYWSKRDYEYGYMVIMMMKLTLKRGMTNMSGAIFCAFAGICGALGDFELAKRLARLGQELDESIGDKSYLCKSMTQNLIFIATTKDAFYLSLDPFLKAHRIGMEVSLLVCTTNLLSCRTRILMLIQVGDLDHSSLCSFCYIIAYFSAGLPLTAMVNDAKMFSMRMTEYGQWQPLSLLKLYHQTALNLMGRATGTPTLLEGEAVANLDAHLYSGAAGDKRRQQYFSNLSMQLAYYFGDSRMALEAAETNASFQDSDWPGFHALSAPFFRALVWIDAARHSRKKKRTYLRKAAHCIRKMEKGTKQGMTNLHHMLLIAKAELRTIACKKQQTEQVRAAFDEAVSVCTRSGFVQNAALTNELAGRFMMRCCDNYWGSHYLKKAVELYREWGADGKVVVLSKEFELCNGRKTRRASMGIRGRARFEEAGQAELHKGQGSNDLWTIAAGSDEF